MILVTGGSGVMGRALIRALHARGYHIRIFTLPGDPAVDGLKDIVEDVRFGDIANSADLSGVCDGIDTVYHLAAIIIAGSEKQFQRINVDGTRHVLEESKRASVKHLIYISSASVIYSQPTPYSLSKRTAEGLVKSSGLQYTIIRPTLVYEKGRGGLEFDMFLKYLRRFPIVPFIGTGKSLKRPVFVEDIIKGLVAVNDNPRAYGKVYNFSGGETISMKAFSRLCLACMNRNNTLIVPVPVWFCRVLATILKWFMKNPPLRRQTIAGIIQDANLDPKEAMVDLGYCPARVSEKLPECFPRTDG